MANTNAAKKLYISSVPVETDLNRAGFEALTWIEVKAVGSFGESGSTTNILSYDTWDTLVTQKAKGITDAGSPEIEVARLPLDPGQILMRNAARVNFNYAFKIVGNDPLSIGGQPTTIYNRGIVTGPKRPNGRNEDFDLEMFTLGLNQIELVVDPTVAGNPPVNTAVPTITGTARVGFVLTASNGTFTGDATIVYSYQWLSGGATIVGANASTYTCQASDLGKLMSVRVTAVNASGTANSTSAPTAAVIAA